MIRSTLPLALAPLALLNGSELSLATDYHREVAWEVSVERGFRLETVEFTMERDGEPMNRGPMGDGGTEGFRTVSFVHSILEHSSEGPARVRRSFDTVEGSSVMTFGDQEQEEDVESPFAGAEIEWRVDGDEPVVEIVDGDVEEEGLEAFSMGLPLDRLLPENGAEEGTTWSIEGDALLAALALDVESTLFPPVPRDGEAGREGGGGRRGGRGGGGRSPGIEALLALEWEVELTLADEEEDSDWGPVARIEFEAAGSGEPPQRGGGGGRGGEGVPPAVEGGVTAELEGVLLYHLEGRHPVQMVCSGPVAIESTTTRQSRQGGEMVIRSVQEGELSVSIGVELVAEDDDESAE